MSMFGKVAVLMGGPSSEREISFLSGNAVLAALKSRGVDAHAFDPAERDLFDLKREGFARAFIALHGRFGEDGTVQGALETLRIPYTGSGVMASALAMDKWRTKLVWLAAGIPTPRYRMVDAGSDWTGVVADLGLPLIVKPSREGSTIGITKVTSHDGQELAAPKQGPPLGLDEAPVYTEGSLRLPGPASLLLYTDGLTEARRDGRFFGIEGVSAVLSVLANPSPTEAIAILRARVADFAYGTLTDDLCMLAARIH